jgi:hypothetical protein
MTTQDFITKAAAESSPLAAKMQAVKAPEDAYAIAKEEGLTDSFEDFVAEMKKWYESLKDLSEGDLDMVAGGMEMRITAIPMQTNNIAPGMSLVTNQPSLPGMSHNVTNNSAVTNALTIVLPGIPSAAI